MLVQDKLQSGEHFTEVDRRIADYLLARGEGLRGETVRQIAARLYVAPSSVMRLAQKLGYDGFNALRDDYLKEIEYLSSHFRQLDPNYPFAKGDAEGVMIGKMLALHQEILADCRSLLTPAALRQAVDLLARARRICLFGTGTHMGVAADFVEKMAKIGREVCPISQTDLALWKALASGGDTCFILFSYTGETTAALSLARQLKKQGIPFIAVTSYGANSLSALGDCVLYLSTREKLTQNLGAFGTTVSMVFLLDLLYSCLFARDYDRSLVFKMPDTDLYDGRHSKNPILEDDAP